jgi:hypothetical protein
MRKTLFIIALTAGFTLMAAAEGQAWTLTLGFSDGPGVTRTVGHGHGYNRPHERRYYPGYRYRRPYLAFRFDFGDTYQRRHDHGRRHDPYYRPRHRYRPYDPYYRYRGSHRHRW